ARNHLFDIASESILIPSCDPHRPEDFLLVVPVSRHLSKWRTILLNVPKIFIEPHHYAALVRRFSDLGKAAQSISQCLPTSDDRMNHDPAPCVSQTVENLILQHVVPKGNERRRPA